MPKATKPLRRVRAARKGAKQSRLALPISAETLAFLEAEVFNRPGRWANLDVLPETAKKAEREAARAKDDAERERHEQAVRAFTSRFYNSAGCHGWMNPKPLRSLDDLVALAVAELDGIVAGRALAEAVRNAAGIDWRKRRVRK